MLHRLARGGFVDRSHERLGRGDVGVVAIRRLWIREIKAMLEGKPLKQWDLTDPVRLAHGASAAERRSSVVPEQSPPAGLFRKSSIRGPISRSSGSFPRYAGSRGDDRSSFRGGIIAAGADAWSNTFLGGAGTGVGRACGVSCSNVTWTRSLWAASRGANGSRPT